MSIQHTLRTAAIAVLITGCAATRGADDDGRSGSGSGTSGSGGQGGGSFSSGGPTGSSSSGGSTEVTELVCAPVAQEILVLDFRCGWWTGGGGGDFAHTALAAMVEPCPNIHVEYHHFEVDFRIRCEASASLSPSCQQVSGSISQASPQEVVGWFAQPSLNDYTQVWILSGSELDAADVALTGSLFDHFLNETSGSCTPVLFGAGDGFIDHGNAVTVELGLGQVFATQLAQPGFFSVTTAMFGGLSVSSHMQAGVQLDNHLLFTGVSELADVVASTFQSAQGDAITENAALYDVIARDTQGRPAIAVGEIDLPDDGIRPFIIDAGFQRYYASGLEPDTRQFLQNLVLYLGLVGCHAEIPA